MAEDKNSNNNSDNTPKSEVEVKPPQSVYIQNTKTLKRLETRDSSK
jgi:hypothetical protein